MAHDRSRRVNVLRRRAVCHDLSAKRPGREHRGDVPDDATLSRSGNHEYYASLPDKAQTKGAEETSQVKRGVYYFAAWNAFSLEFIGEDITPYKVFTVGQMEEELAALLETAGAKLTIIVEE